MDEHTGSTRLSDCIMYTREQAAALLNISISTLDKLKKAGQLKPVLVSVTPGAKRPKPLFHRDELERFAQSLRGD